VRPKRLKVEGKKKDLTQRAQRGREHDDQVPDMAGARDREQEERTVSEE
jgi:hypothetical protein